MPWTNMEIMDQKIQLIADWLSNEFSITDLSQKYQISRPVVYKWIERYEQFGLEGLKDQSRAPIHRHKKTPESIIRLIVKEKINNIKRGPKKVHATLKQKYPFIRLPSPSTIGYWLKKNGLVNSRKIRRHVAPYSNPFLSCHCANSVWSADYKGQFFMKNRQKCYPLTISDNYSRYLLMCSGLTGPKYKESRAVFESAFRNYGLPNAIRTDNGIPFASTAMGGISRLMIWWIQLGIVPERIKKGNPQQNGRHERMHRTLKFESLDKIAQDLKEQQKRFDLFRYEYNNHRPHEALDQNPPAKVYTKSKRTYIEHPKEPEYDSSFKVRIIQSNGTIKIKGRRYYVSETLHGKPVGIKKIADGLFNINYGFYHLGSINVKKDPRKKV